MSVLDIFLITISSYALTSVTERFISSEPTRMSLGYRLHKLKHKLNRRKKKGDI